VSATLDRHGYGATRLAIAELSPVAHIAWKIARREGFDSCFDWEFCPQFTARALSWSPDGAELPALRSDWRDISRAIGRGDTLQTMRATLERHGFIVGEREPRINTLHPGAFMVAEAFEDSELPTLDGRNGPWAIVGDNLESLIRQAFDAFNGDRF